MADGYTGFVLSWPSGRISGRALAGGKPLGSSIKMLRRHIRDIPMDERTEAKIKLWANVFKHGGSVKRIILASGTGVDQINLIVERAREAWRDLPKQDDQNGNYGEIYPHKLPQP